jgi:hypothetical protein
MLTVPAVKVQQFRQEFFLLNLSATDVRRLAEARRLMTARAVPAPHANAGSSARFTRRRRSSGRSFRRSRSFPALRQCRFGAAVPAVERALVSEEPVVTAGTNRSSVSCR